MTFDFEKSRSYLVCPKCHSDLVLDGDALVCTDPEVRLRYPILEGIPRLLIDEAEELSPEAWQAVMHRAAKQSSQTP
jgi:uncharacterized protein YbaR (Trm112 family)